MSDDAKTRLVPLLRRWAELEPERCRQRVDVIDVRLSNDPPPAISWECVYPHGRGANFWEQDVGSIQAAVQSAIEARGWEWTVARDNNLGSTGVEFYRAWINKRRTTSMESAGPDRFVRDSMDSACVALLSAYIAALEHEARTCEGNATMGVKSRHLGEAIGVVTEANVRKLEERVAACENALKRMGQPA